MLFVWDRHTIAPPLDAFEALCENWRWLLGDAMRPILAAASGDVFLETRDGSIHHLDTGQGTLTRTAGDSDRFLHLLRGDAGVEWTLAPLIDRAISSGNVLSAGHCYGFKQLPILGGAYSPDNMAPMPAAQWYAFSGYLHAQLKDLPDGAQVSFRIDDA